MRKSLNFFFTTVVLLLLSAANLAHGYDENLYNSPISFDKKYASSIQTIIQDALKERDWAIKEKSDGVITAWLNDYKGYELILNIEYGETEISFEHVSFKKLSCSSCVAEDKYYGKWRTNLRRTIAKHLHRATMMELVNDKPSVQKVWLGRLKSSNSKDQIKLARAIIELQFYDEETLNVIEQVIRADNLKSLRSGDIQRIAYYCKALQGKSVIVF